MKITGAVQAAIVDHYSRVWSQTYQLQNAQADDWRTPVNQAHVAAQHAVKLLRESLPDLLGSTESKTRAPGEGRENDEPRGD